METKMLAPHPPSGAHHRGARFYPPIYPWFLDSHLRVGYSAPGKEKVVHHIYDPDELAQNRAKAPDVKESFEIGREHDDAMPNILLPDGVLPGFNEACLDFFWVSA